MSLSENPWVTSKIILDLQNDSTAKAPVGVTLNGDIAEIEELPKPKAPKIIKPKPAVIPATEITSPVLPVETPYDEIPIKPKTKPSAVGYKTIATIQEFWTFVNSLQWRDSSESTLGMQVVVPEKINGIKIDTFLQFATPLITTMIAKITPFAGTKSDIVTKVAWHILARGKEFYDQLSSCPDFCVYLFEGEYMDFEALVTKK